MLKAAHKDDSIGKLNFTSDFVGRKMVTSVDDKFRFGHPSTARKHRNVEKIRELVLTVRPRLLRLEY